MSWPQAFEYTYQTVAFCAQVNNLCLHPSHPTSSWLLLAVLCGCFLARWVRDASYEFIRMSLLMTSNDEGLDEGITICLRHVYPDTWIINFNHCFVGSTYVTTILCPNYVGAVDVFCHYVGTFLLTCVLRYMLSWKDCRHNELKYEIPFLKPCSGWKNNSCFFCVSLLTVLFFIELLHFLTLHCW